jgi:uncharacterized membrane protein YdbT with pleckstrin-like domain
MSYIENNLLTDEKIISISRPHWIIFAGPVFGAIFAFAVLIFGPDFFMTRELIMGYPVYDLVAIVCGIFSLYYFLSSWVTYVTSEFGITNKRVLMKTGFIRRDSLELFLEKIEAIHVEQSIPGRVFDYGCIIVIGTGGTKDPFFYIPSPIVFRKTVQQQIDLIDQKYQDRKGGT